MESYNVSFACSKHPEIQLQQTWGAKGNYVAQTMAPLDIQSKESPEIRGIAYSDSELLAKQPVHGITFRTPRLLLRPLTFEDIPDIFLMRSDPEVARFT